MNHLKRQSSIYGIIISSDPREVQRMRKQTLRISMYYEYIILTTRQRLQILKTKKIKGDQNHLFYFKQSFISNEVNID